MNTIKTELIRLGIDPSMISDEALVRLKTVCTKKETLATFQKSYADAVTEHDLLADAAADLAHRASVTLLSLAKLPAPPKRGFSSACVRMLTNISAARDGVLAEQMCELAVLRDRLDQGRQARLTLAKERSLLHLASLLYKTEIPLPCEEELVLLFGDAPKAELLRLSALLCETEAYLIDLALTTARVAKRIDSGVESPTEYGRLIEGARIRLHDAALAAEHIRKEIDSVKIHTCS